MAPHSSTLAWEIPWMEETWGAVVHGIAEGRTRLSDFTFTFLFHALEKEMATHSSVLAWRIPGTEEPSRLPSLGSHRVRHNWSDLASRATIPSFWSSVVLCRALAVCTSGSSLLSSFHSVPLGSPRHDQTFHQPSHSTIPFVCIPHMVQTLDSLFQQTLFPQFFLYCHLIFVDSLIIAKTFSLKPQMCTVQFDSPQAHVEI